MLLLETNQKFINFICYRLQRNAFSIYLPYFTNDLSKQFLRDGLEWVDVRDKWNFRAGSLWLYVYGSEIVMPGTDIYFILSIKRMLDRLG